MKRRSTRCWKTQTRRSLKNCRLTSATGEQLIFMTSLLMFNKTSLKFMEQIFCSMPQRDNCWFYKEMFYAFGNKKKTTLKKTYFEKSAKRWVLLAKKRRKKLFCFLKRNAMWMKVLHKVLFFVQWLRVSVTKPEHFRSLTPTNKQEVTVPGVHDDVVCHRNSSECPKCFLLTSIPVWWADVEVLALCLSSVPQGGRGHRRSASCVWLIELWKGRSLRLQVKRIRTVKGSSSQTSSSPVPVLSHLGGRLIGGMSSRAECLLNLWAMPNTSSTLVLNFWYLQVLTSRL